MLIDTPVEFADTPADLGVSVFGNDAVHAELNEEGADGMDDLGVDDIDGEVSRREDADGLLLRVGLKGPLDSQRVVVGYRVSEGCDCFDIKGIVDVGKGAMCGCRKMAREEVGEGQLVGALRVCGLLGDETPGFEYTRLVYTIWAVFCYWLFGGRVAL